MVVQCLHARSYLSINRLHSLTRSNQPSRYSFSIAMAVSDLVLSASAGVVAATIAGGLLVYSIGLAIYRAFFHPLAKVPGPWLAGVTQWYETYYELVPNGGGMFTKRIKKMHEQYGAYRGETQLNDLKDVQTPNHIALPQDQSFASTLTKSTSTIQNTTRRSTPPLSPTTSSYPSRTGSTCHARHS